MVKEKLWRLKRKQVKSELEKLTIRDEKRIRLTLSFTYLLPVVWEVYYERRANRKRNENTIK